MTELVDTFKEITSRASPICLMKKSVLAMFVWVSLFYWAAELQGQGVINFNEPWIGTPGVIIQHQEYLEQGMWFRVVNSYGQPPVSPIERWSAAMGANSPYNGTPFIKFLRNRYDDHVVISTDNGSEFGLVSVDLADWIAPSYTHRSIVFEGYRPGYYNPFVSVTFTTSGGGTSSFETFYFPADFASGLAWVPIRSTGWAMDNLVWIPEPSALALLIAGSAGLLLRRFRRQTPNR